MVIALWEHGTLLATWSLPLKWPSGELELTGLVCTLILRSAPKLPNAFKLSSANAQRFSNETWVTVTLFLATSNDAQSRALKMMQFPNSNSMRNTCCHKSTLWGCRRDLQDFSCGVLFTYVFISSSLLQGKIITPRSLSHSLACLGSRRQHKTTKISKKKKFK